MPLTNIFLIKICDFSDSYITVNGTFTCAANKCVTEIHKSDMGYSIHGHFSYILEANSNRSIREKKNLKTK